MNSGETSSAQTVSSARSRQSEVSCTVAVGPAGQGGGEGAIGEQRWLESVGVVVADAARLGAGFAPAESGEHVGDHQPVRLGERRAVALVGEPGKLPRAARDTEIGLVLRR